MSNRLSALCCWARYTGMLSLFAFIISFPFKYTLLPCTGYWLKPVSEGLIQFTNRYFLRYTEPLFIASDSLGLYIHLFHLLLISVLVAAMLTAWVQTGRNQQKITGWLRVCFSYYLALQLFLYGFNKIFKLQFYLPEPNTLFTPLGQLTPDILYWSTMGSSYTYTVFAGLAEVIPAILLLFYRTRTSGAVIAVAVLLNVFMVNIGFDITVKVYAFFLLMLSVLIAWPALKSAYLVYVLHQHHIPAQRLLVLNTTKKIALYALVKALVVVAILFEACYVYLQTMNFNDDHYPRTSLHGAYQVVNQEASGAELRADLPGRYKRIFFHRQGYFITQTAGDVFRDERCSVDTINKRVFIQKSLTHTAFTFNYRQSADTLELVTHNACIRAIKIDISQMPLLHNKMHWVERSGG